MPGKLQRQTPSGTTEYRLVTETVCQGLFLSTASSLTPTLSDPFWTA